MHYKNSTSKSQVAENWLSLILQCTQLLPKLRSIHIIWARKTWIVSWFQWILKQKVYIFIWNWNLIVNFHCSTEKRSGHIPYRDSKLTRILQLSLGGNARTAIICTMSPALTHVEQSRNTLFFATCAKEVTNTAKVNMVRVVSCDWVKISLSLIVEITSMYKLINSCSIQVVSDKQLVKHLQTEVARLEAELRTPDRSSSSDILIMEKDRKIRQVNISDGLIVSF